MRSIGFLLFFAMHLASCRSFHADDEDESGLAAVSPAEGPKSHVLFKAEIKLKEISGLATLPSASGASTVAAVGDKKFQLWRQQISVQGLEGEAVKVDFRSLVEPRDHSQWEGLAVDGKGKFVILVEDPPTLEIFSDGNLLNAVTLAKSEEEDIGSEENSSGEGLVLLKGGHVLLAKEKDPPLLIEFGPSGDTPFGASSDRFLDPKAEWPVPLQGNKFVPLKIWGFDDEAEGLIEDISDLAVGPGNSLYVLSQKSKRIARMEDTLRVDEDKASIRAYWDIANSIEAPEGMTFLGNHPVVASDQESGSHNIFVLEPLATP